MTLVAGDPASCSRVGGSLRQLATALRSSGRAVHGAMADPDLQRPGTVVARARRRLTGLDEAAAAASDELDRVGAALQDHAADLAEALADVRALVARAEAAGLRETDGRLAPAWGVTGLADAPADAGRDERRESLQAELDRLLAVLAARRRRLAAGMAASGSVLADHARALRR
ncbi:hypothetical protein [Phycicoccus sp. Root101]|uniref:hypothetical protein n=1 Tax=Phycicoccus sp. Root101 TaxID=1736421 RepID=UPI0007025F3D|nr:hypothetical protein [Phycicoccus sp. Root101]KQU69486.1 hypothetical protein ASC58_06300 [Phycicoccus sp. Root101]